VNQRACSAVLLHAIATIQTVASVRAVHVGRCGEFKGVAEGRCVQ
jgi:hypothetical protein